MERWRFLLGLSCVLFSIRRVGKILLNVAAVRWGCLPVRSCGLFGKIFVGICLFRFYLVEGLFCRFVRRVLFSSNYVSRQNMRVLGKMLCVFELEKEGGHSG